MKQSRIRTLNLKTRSVSKDAEGVPVESWGNATPIKVELWPAGGQLQVQTYGNRVNNMMNVKVWGRYTIVSTPSHESYDFGDFILTEGDGLCVYSNDKPDYRIISIKPYKPMKMEIERI